MLVFEPNKPYIRLIERYNWRRKGRPNFTFYLESAENVLYGFALKAGHKTGILEAMP